VTIIIPTGSKLTSGSKGFVHVWDAATGQLEHTMECLISLSGEDDSITFSRDGSKLTLEVDYHTILVCDMMKCEVTPTAEVNCRHVLSHDHSKLATV
jgi:hypothetical protein